MIFCITKLNIMILSVMPLIYKGPVSTVALGIMILRIIILGVMILSIMTFNIMIRSKMILILAK
jgi:hypothetical protein